MSNASGLGGFSLDVVVFTWGTQLLPLPNPEVLGGCIAIDAFCAQCGNAPSAESHETEWEGARR